MSKNSFENFFAQIQNHLKTEEMLTVMRSYEEIIWKLNLLQKIFGQNLLEKSENFRLNPKCNLRFILQGLAIIGMPYMRF